MMTFVFLSVLLNASTPANDAGAALGKAAPVTAVPAKFKANDAGRVDVGKTTPAADASTKSKVNDAGLADGKGSAIGASAKLKTTDAGVSDAGRPAPVPEMSAQVKALVDRMQQFYEKSPRFKAQFRQEYTYKLFNRTTVSTGTVLYLRNEKGPQMRWDYEKPDAKSFVLADEKVRLYDPQALTLMVSPLASDKLSASVTFLWGKGRLLNEFSIVEKNCAKCTGTLLEMTPLHPDPRFRQVLLEVDPKTAIVLASTVIDPDGSTNLIRFINLDTTTAVKNEQFVLNVAKGTQLIDLGAANATRDAGAPAR